MDLNSLIGLLLALAGIVGGQLIEGGRLGSLFQFAAFLIVLGGTMGAILLQSPYRVFVAGLKLARWVLYPPVFDRAGLARTLTQWSQVTRREGLLSLEQQIPRVNDPFLRRGLQMVVDGLDPDGVRNALTVEIDSYAMQQREAARTWEAAGGYAPTIGILGAVLGLIHTMENLTDPGKLGGGIAVAFVATIYGVAFANLVFLPVAAKLKGYIAGQVEFREMMIDGLVGIANGENPRLIESRLAGYVR